MLWLRSSERSEALKRDDYTCQKCAIRVCYAKGHEVLVEVNHKKGVGNWDKIVELIRKELLCSPEHLEVLCKNCHKEVTQEQRISK